MKEQTIYTSEKHNLTEENKTYFYSEKKNSKSTNLCLDDPFYQVFQASIALLHVTYVS